MTDAAAGSYVAVASLADLPPGRMMRVKAGDKAVVLYNVDGQVYATTPNCFHRGGLLDEGDLEGAIVTCPWHGWQFDCRTGENVRNAEARIETYPTRTDGGTIFVKVPA